MNIDLSDLSPAQVYFTLIQTVIPRPIAWVLSENANGTHNLAPFSYFNAVCANPPLLMISVGRKPDGSFKDTRVNIEQRHDFVIHIVQLSMLEAMNQSSATLPAGVSEIRQLGLALTGFPGGVPCGLCLRVLPDSGHRTDAPGIDSGSGQARVYR